MAEPEESPQCPASAASTRTRCSVRRRQRPHGNQEAPSKNLQGGGSFHHPHMSKLPQTASVRSGTTPGRQKLGTVALPRPFSRASSSAHSRLLLPLFLEAQTPRLLVSGRDKTGKFSGFYLWGIDKEDKQTPITPSPVRSSLKVAPPDRMHILYRRP